jgi:hypothetical protein
MKTYPSLDHHALAEPRTLPTLNEKSIMTTYRSRSSLSLWLGASAVAAAMALAGCYTGAAGSDQAPDELSAVSSDPAGDPEQPLGDSAQGSSHLADGEERVGGELVAELDIGGGSKLIFIGVGEEGRTSDVFVVSSLAPGSIDPSTFPELRNASPLELFNAVAPPGTPLPDTITRLYGDQPKLGPEGWMLEAIKVIGSNALMQTTGYCNNESFKSTVSFYEYDDRNTPLYRLDQVPEVNTDNVWTDYYECFGASWENNACPWFFLYQKIWDNVDGFYGRVAVCDLDNHPALSWWSHPGPTIQFLNRGPNDASYNLAFEVDVAANQVGHAWKMHGTAINYDWKTVVMEAEAYDGFDIGTAVEDL